MKDKNYIWQKAKIKNTELNNRIIRSATNETFGNVRWLYNR